MRRALVYAYQRLNPKAWGEGKEKKSVKRGLGDNIFFPLENSITIDPEWWENFQHSIGNKKEN